MKSCSRCKKSKLPNDFYLDKRQSDGLYSCCKACHNLGTDINKKRKWRQKNREKFFIYGKKYEMANPDRHAAHMAVNCAIRRGDLSRKPCIICGTQKFVDAHHENYKKKLDVIWLCRKHHRKIHR